MREQASHNRGGLDLDLVRRIDAVCRRFEADYRAGKSPVIADYLGEIPDVGRSALRSELIGLEQEMRQSDETSARPDSGPIADAPTIEPASPPTAPIPGLGNPSVHEEATVAPRDQATVDLGSCTPAPPEASGPARVRYFGDYEIERELARGGMGVVFRARQISLNRPVALKMILAGQLANDTDVKRFYTEAEAAANLDHPGIVPIFEVGQHEGQHYFSMGFVEGQSLAQKLADGPLPLREAAALMVKVAEAVEYAHNHGVIHRDLKPANILLDQAGNPRVTDFGLAKKLEADSGLTGSGQIMGTPSYMPPEQAGGRRGEVGPAADVYALGATLYALVTGRPPFQAATPMDTLLQVISDEPVSPRRLNASVPLDLETICLKCLEKEPGKRYAGAAAMGEDLRCLLAGEPIWARPVGSAERAWRWCRRNPVVAGLAAGIALALVLGTVVATYFAIRAGRNAERAEANLRLANQETARANVAAAKATAEADRADREAQHVREEKWLSDRRLYVAEINLGQQAWRESNTRQLRRHLDAQRPVQPGAPDTRGFEWYYLDRLRQADLRTLPGTEQGLFRRVKFSPDGRTLAYAGDDGTVRLRDAATGEERQTLRGHTASITQVALSSDGRTLASASYDNTMKLWDTANGKELRTLSGHKAMVSDVAFSPDGRTLASASKDATVKLWETATGREIHTLSGHANWATGVAFSADGRTLASVSMDQTVKLWDANGHRLIRTIRGNEAPLSAVAFSPVGPILAWADWDHGVRLWDTTAERDPLTLPGHEVAVVGVAFSPDGRTLASAGLDSTVRLWDVATGRENRTLRGNEAGVEGVAFSPDGRVLASISWRDGVKLWDFRAGDGPETLRGSGNSVTAVAYSPDGHTLASAGHDDTVKLWDAATGQLIRNFGRAIFPIFPAVNPRKKVVFSPDGRTLASTCRDQTVKVWDATTGGEVRVFPGAKAVLDAAFSPDGCCIAVATSSDIFKLYDIATGGEIRTFRGHAGAIERLAFSPDGRTLASAGDDRTVKVWEAASGREVRTLRGHTEVVFGVAFSPDGRLLASSGHDWTVRIWDAATGQEIDTLIGQGMLFPSLAFGPDGRTLAFVGEKGVVKIWDVTTRQELLILARHQGILNGLAFSRDGRRIAGAGADGTVLIWDATPVTPELRVFREARSVVAFLSAGKLPAAEIAARIRRDPTISDEVRRRALELAEHPPARAAP
jgi:WD40 repeat protein